MVACLSIVFGTFFFETQFGVQARSSLGSRFYRASGIGDVISVPDLVNTNTTPSPESPLRRSAFLQIPLHTFVGSMENLIDLRSYLSILIRASIRLSNAQISKWWKKVLVGAARFSVLSSHLFLVVLDVRHIDVFLNTSRSAEMRVWDSRIASPAF